MRLFLLLAALACTSGGGGGQDTGADGGSADGGADGGGDGGSGDGGGQQAELVYPDGDRALIYTGHGGITPQSTGKASFEDLDAAWEALGYNTHYREELPDDMTIYRVIALVAPGSTAAVPFTAEEVARLELARSQGSRIAVLGDLAMCGSADVAALLADLGVTGSFTGDGADTNQLIITGDIDDDAQPTAGVSSLFFRDPCHVDPGQGDRIVSDSLGNGLVTLELPADGGEVLLVGDLELLDDANLDEEDNAVFADNLVRVTP